MNSLENKISAVIVTFNRLDKLKVSVGMYEHEPIDNLFIVDNCSSDGTKEWLEKKKFNDSRIHVLRLKNNLGGAGGFEAGMRFADDYLNGMGWIVMHDDDAYPAFGALATFRNRLGQGRYEGYTCVASSVVTPAGDPVDINRPILNIFRYPRETMQRVIGKTRNLRDLYHVPSSDLLDKYVSYPIHAASFVGIFLKLENLPISPNYRYPDPNLFIYGDDTIYTANLLKNNKKLLLDSALRYVHDTDTGYQDGVLIPEWKNYYVSRNSLSVYCCISSWLGPLLYIIALTRRLRAILSINNSISRYHSMLAYLLGIRDALVCRYRPHHEVVCLSRKNLKSLLFPSR